jgi:hypothetical protein
LALPRVEANVACDAERQPLREVPPDDSSFHRQVLRCQRCHRPGPGHVGHAATRPGLVGRRNIAIVCAAVAIFNLAAPDVLLPRLF